MTRKRMQARYPGTCCNCGHRFPKGATIDYDKYAPQGSKTAHADCPQGRIVEFEFNGEYGPSYAYQNSNGRCEDAPCCGCCTC